MCSGLPVRTFVLETSNVVGFECEISTSSYALPIIHIASWHIWRARNFVLDLFWKAGVVRKRSKAMKRSGAFFNCPLLRLLSWSVTGNIVMLGSHGTWVVWHLPTLKYVTKDPADSLGVAERVLVEFWYHGLWKCQRVCEVFSFLESREYDWILHHGSEPTTISHSFHTTLRYFSNIWCNVAGWNQLHVREGCWPLVSIYVGQWSCICNGTGGCPSEKAKSNQGGPSR